MSEQEISKRFSKLEIFFSNSLSFFSSSFILFARNRISFTNTVTMRNPGIPFPNAFEPMENSAPENKSLQHSLHQFSFNQIIDLKYKVGCQGVVQLRGLVCSCPSLVPLSLRLVSLFYSLKVSPKNVNRSYVSML